jgi:tetratricopeptide (TPR) repeat protein
MSSYAKPALVVAFWCALVLPQAPPAAAQTAPPAQVRALIEEGRSHLRRRDAERALERFAAAARLAPADGMVRLWLGRALLAKGDAANAVRELEYATQTRPDDPDPYVALARAYRAMDLPEAAEDTGRRLVARGHPRGHWIVGRSLRQQDRRREALAAFDAYLRAATDATPTERAAIERYRAAAAERPTGAAEARDMIAWADDLERSRAHRMAYDAYIAITQVSESERQGTWPYWLSHYETLAFQYYPMLGQAIAKAQGIRPRTELVRGLHQRYLTLLSDLDRTYLSFLEGVRTQNQGPFLAARQRLPQLGEAFDDFIEDVDDASDDLSDRD